MCTNLIRNKVSRSKYEGENSIKLLADKLKDLSLGMDNWFWYWDYVTSCAIKV